MNPTIGGAFYWQGAGTRSTSCIFQTEDRLRAAADSAEEKARQQAAQIQAALRVLAVALI